MAYTKKEKDEKFDQVCERISTGEALRSILKPANPIFSIKVFYELLDSDEEKSKQYARACEARADLLFDQILVISDATSEDIIKDPDTGMLIVNHNIIQRDRLRVDARKWALSKMNPKKYGDKIEQNINLDGKITHITGMEIL